MRDYGKVYGTFWSSQTTHSLSDDGKLLALYLMTCSHATIAGVFRLPDGYVAEDIGWDQSRVQQGFIELLSNGFANRCETTKWVWVVKHLEWNKPENPNQRKSAAKIALSVPSECAWRLDFMRVCGESLGLEDASDSNRSTTVKQPLPNQEQEQEQDKEHVGSTPSKPRTQSASRFAEFWQAWPAGPRKQARAECEKRWKARGLDSLADEIVGHVQSLLKTKQFQEFTPSPLTYLNQRRWEDGAPSGDGEQAESSLFRGAL